MEYALSTFAPILLFGVIGIVMSCMAALVARNMDADGDVKGFVKDMLGILAKMPWLPYLFMPARDQFQLIFAIFFAIAITVALSRFDIVGGDLPEIHKPDFAAHAGSRSKRITRRDLKTSSSNLKTKPERGISSIASRVRSLPSAIKGDKAESESTRPTITDEYDKGRAGKWSSVERLCPMTVFHPDTINERFHGDIKGDTEMAGESDTKYGIMLADPAATTQVIMFMDRGSTESVLALPADKVDICVEETCDPRFELKGHDGEIDHATIRIGNMADLAQTERFLYVKRRNIDGKKSVAVSFGSDTEESDRVLIGLRTADFLDEI